MESDPLHVHTPVGADGLAGSDAQAVSAGDAGHAEAQSLAGGPPANEASQSETTSTPPSPTSSPGTTAITVATEGRTRAITREQREVVDASATEQEAEDKDGAQRPRPHQRQPPREQPRAEPLACAPAVTNKASSQSLVLLTACATSGGSDRDRVRDSNASTLPADSPLGSPLPSPTPRQPSPEPSGTLVLVPRAISRSPRSSRSSSAAGAGARLDGSLSLDDLPNEVLLHILGFLDVNDLLTASRTSHHLRCLCVAPILHTLRRRQVRAALPPLLASPMRPSLSDLIARHIFMTNTTVVSRKLARSLVSIRLSRRLAARPPAQLLVERCVLPPECAPGIGHVAPALAARTRAVEREKLKDGLRRWVGAVWKREVGRRSERIRRFDESVGIGKVWRLRKFWERVSHEEGV
ncbi:hypothetical protein HMPREF1624_00735 [Sporothrix schenckii ATCC 58251]|uniref:F-box domain-containing protein n=1 Tax=Sporothrix schenckii (strain ATCC 58251 / de Perez 2211183) TaxID=1391915 RepID=U7Q5K1_SPOS1|nr:hypothetical protein HMPREF1624_00735 [Sporothrix schenckii ATCC 58251]